MKSIYTPDLFAKNPFAPGLPHRRVPQQDAADLLDELFSTRREHRKIPRAFFTIEDEPLQPFG